MLIHPALFDTPLAAAPYPQHHGRVEESVTDGSTEKHDLAAQIEGVHLGLCGSEPATHRRLKAGLKVFVGVNPHRPGALDVETVDPVLKLSGIVLPRILPHLCPK